jgi:hypothetical protein
MSATLFTFSQIGFIVVTVIFFGLILHQMKQALSKSDFDVTKQKRIIRQVAIALLAWTCLLSGLSISGFISNFNTIPPRFVIIVFIPLATLVWALLVSRTTRQILNYVPPQVILYLQVFRVAVEILLWLLFIQNLLPIQMTFEGRNFDIIAGITGPIVAYFGMVKNKWPKAILIGWNFISLGLLINIVTIAILSLPTPFRYFMNEPPNVIVADFPFVWLPGLLVPMAYGLHFLSIRQLVNQKD